MPLEYGDEIWRQKTRIMGLPHGEGIVGRTTWAQSTSVTDGQTDGQIYGDYTALCIASRCNNLLVHFETSDKAAYSTQHSSVFLELAIVE